MENINLLLLLIIFLGISLLLTISLITKPIELNISEINLKHLNKEVKITGEIINIKPISGYNFTIITLQNKTKTIDITVDKTLNKNKLTHKNVIIIGKVTSYKNEIQIKSSLIKLNPKN